MPRATGRNQGKGNCTGNGQGRGRGKGFCRSSAIDQENGATTNAPLRRGVCTQDGKGQGRALADQDLAPNDTQK